MMTNISSLAPFVLAALFAALSTASAFVVGPSYSYSRKSSSRKSFTSFKDAPVNGSLHQTPSSTSSSKIPSSAASSATDFVRNLLEGMANCENDGAKMLLESSSASWRDAIFEAVGAPSTADPKIVAKALGDAMCKPNNQFAILVGKADPSYEYDLEFPSDPVEYNLDEGRSFVEVRLRNKADSELLVTMGIQLQLSDDGKWLVSKLDWQDFRDEFYPGLSGREWLRAF